MPLVREFCGAFGGASVSKSARRTLVYEHRVKGTITLASDTSDRVLVQVPNEYLRTAWISLCIDSPGVVSSARTSRVQFGIAGFTRPRPLD